MNEHEKWQSRRIYHETYSVPTRMFAFWQGTSRRCKCGCGEVWYDRISPVNWWTIFNLATHLSVSWQLAHVLLAFHKLLWHTPPVIWVWFKILRAKYRMEVLVRVPPGASTFIAVATARLLLYGCIAPVVVVACALAWTIAGPGVILTSALYFLTLGLYLALATVVMVLSVIAISMTGLVFIIGGAGSILYLDYPAIGIAAIVIGVGVQYEINRREALRREEQLGHLIAMLRAQSQSDE